MKSKYLPLCRSENIVIQKLADETLLYDLEVDKAFCLNETSALIWGACDGKKTLAEISSELTKKLNSTITEEIVFLALNSLNKEGLLVHNDKFNNKFNGMSRREVIKKIGLATAVALPVISSLIAPTAADALSCFASGVVCSTSRDTFSTAQCCSGTCLYRGASVPNTCL